MVDEKKPLDEKQVVARRKQVDDKRVELKKLEDETPKFYLGRPVTIIAETHPSRQWTIRFDDTGETEVVQKHQVTDTIEVPAPALGPAEVSLLRTQKAAQDVADRDAKRVKDNKLDPVTKQPVVETKSDTPVKEWFKK